MLRRRKKILLVLAVALILVTQVLASSVIYSVYALVPPDDSKVIFHWDLDTVKGFEKTGWWHEDSPIFVLRQGMTGSFNITLTSFEDERTVLVGPWRLGGNPPYDKGWGMQFGPPDGISYSFEPNGTSLAPGAKATTTIRITAAPDTEIRGYNLTVIVELRNGVTHEEQGHSTILTIVEAGNPLTTTSSIVASNVTTTTTTVTITQTSTTTFPTTITNTVTSTSAERVADTSIYAWAASATVAAAVFAVVVLLLQRRRAAD